MVCVPLVCVQAHEVSELRTKIRLDGCNQIRVSEVTNRRRPGMQTRYAKKCLSDSFLESSALSCFCLDGGAVIIALRLSSPDQRARQQLQEDTAALAAAQYLWSRATLSKKIWPSIWIVW